MIRVAVPPPSPDERAAFKQDLRAVLNCLDAAEAREAALLTRQEALERMLAYLWDASGKFGENERVRDMFADDDPLVADVTALLDASQPVKP